MRTPIFFIGHGSPMNALAENEFTKALASISARFKKPDAIVMISAHWQMDGVYVTAMEKPPTIYDFYGFPQELFQIKYQASGAPEIAMMICDQLTTDKVTPDFKWGLDHGSWSVLRHIFPMADIPVVQLSLSQKFSAKDHFELGKRLSFLREKNIWIMASGNLIHNLRLIKWENGATPYDWALSYDKWLKERLVSKDFYALTKNYLDSSQGKLSSPTNEHYYPLLYILGASHPDDKLEFIFEEIQNGSIGMRSFYFA